MLVVVYGPPVMSYEDYDPNYPRVFERLTADIRAVLPAARVEHVGAASVPGLGGRRVIDAVVIVSDDAQPATASALLAAGFTRSPFAWIEPTSTTSVQVGGVSYPRTAVRPRRGASSRAWVAGVQRSLAGEP